jgi:phosphatidylinositol glycan class B
MTESSVLNPLSPASSRAPIVSPQQNVAAKPRRRREVTIALFSILLFALLIRYFTIVSFPNLNHPDEIYQVLEQAHRLVTGVGVVPWEFKFGVRSWIFPGLLVPFIYLAGLVKHDPNTSVRVVYFVMALFSLVPVACGFLWGLRAAGMFGAIVVGLVTATFADLVYFAPHTLNDVLAGHAFILGLYLAYPKERADGRRLFAAGILMGLTFILRFHLAPGLALAAIWVCRAERRRWLLLLTGALPPLLLGGVLDWITWRYPFQSIWLNVWMNLYQGVSHTYGVVPWYYTFGFLVYFWGGAFAFIWIFAILGARRLPLLLAVALTTIAAYSLIAHKEYRFIYPVLPLIAILAGIGTVDSVEALSSAGVIPANRLLGLGLATSVWVLTSLALFASAPFQYLLTRDVGEIKAFRMLSGDPGTCGIGVYQLSIWSTPGYSYLRPGIGLYELDSQKDLAVQSAAINSVIANQSVTVPDPRFERRSCFANGYKVRTNQLAEPVCVWIRSGSCSSSSYQQVFETNVSN